MHVKTDLTRSQFTLRGPN